MSNGAIKAIKILQNKAGSFITQSVTGDKVADAVSKVTAIPQANEYNIYWVELVDDEHIQLGINGVATMTVSKNDLGSWPFEILKQRDREWRLIGFVSMLMMLIRLKAMRRIIEIQYSINKLKRSMV
mgnify:CR=1 FL=1